MKPVNYQERNEVLFELYFNAETTEQKLDIENQIIKANMKLVYTEAHRFKASGIEFEDLQSIAMFGMMQAIRSFQPGNGTRFATFAYRCIRNIILKQLVLEERRANLQTAYSMDQDFTGTDLNVADVIEDWKVNVIKTCEDRDQIGRTMEAANEILNNDEKILLKNMMHHKRLNQFHMGDILNISSTRVQQIEKKLVQKLNRYFQFESQGKPYKAPKRGRRPSIFTQEQYQLMNQNGITPVTATNRVKILGWTIEKAVTTPTGNQARKRVQA